MAECSMTEEDKEEAEAQEEFDSHFAYVSGLMALCATYAVGFLLETKHIHWIPEAAVGVAMGGLSALLAKLIHNDGMLALEKFDFGFFMTFLLPPIIFEAGYNMNVTEFFKNIVPTMLYAFLGTFMSTFVVGGLVYYAGTLGWCYPLGLLPSLVFGSLISATDPVTVLAVFQALRVKDDLFSMVFGESVLNDAVAIVLSRTLLMFIHVEVSPSSIAAAGVTFCKIFGGSVLIGGVFGVLSALVFKYLHMKEHHDILFLECALSFTFPWAAYYVAEGLELSGIVTILFCGIVMATYTRHNMSDEEPGVEKGKGGAVVLTSRIFKCIALVAETYVFVYLGMAMVTFPIFEHTTVWLIIVALGACFVGRLHIYLFSFITNLFRGKDSSPPPITGTYMHIMWFSGLRGGVAFALASVSYAHGAKGHFPSQCVYESSSGESYTTHTDCDGLPGYFSDSLAILQTTMLIAVFTIVVFGGSITSVCRAAGVIKPKGFIAVDEKPTGKQKEMHNYLLEFLTRETTYEVEHGQRFGAAVDGQEDGGASKPKTKELL